MNIQENYPLQKKTDYGCGKCLNTVGVIGLTSNLILAFLKGGVGILFFNTALLADALYSVLDIGFSILIIVGLKISSKPPDKNHEYGHGKVEFIITIIFSVFTILGAVLLFIYALFELHEGVIGQYSHFVLLTALISIVANLLFYRFTSCVAAQFYSPSIRSLAMHSQADAISSLLVTISMICAYWGYNSIGSFVAIIETAHLLFIGSEIFKNSFYGLIDAAISPEDIHEIKLALTHLNGITNIRKVKSRKIGQKIWLNIEIEVPAAFSMEKTDLLKKDINETLKEKVQNLEKIMISIVPSREQESDDTHGDQILRETKQETEFSGPEPELAG